MQIPGLGGLGELGAVIGGPAAGALLLAYYARRQYNNLTHLEKKHLHKAIQKAFQSCYDNFCVRSIIGRCITLPSVEELRMRELVDEIEDEEEIAINKVTSLENEIKEDAKKVKQASLKSKMAKAGFDNAQESGIEELIVSAQEYLIITEQIFRDKQRSLELKKQELERARKEAKIIHDKVIDIHEGNYGAEIAAEVRAIEEADIENQNSAKEDAEETKSEEENEVNIRIIRPKKDSIERGATEFNLDHESSAPKARKAYRVEDQDLAREEMIELGRLRQYDNGSEVNITLTTEGSTASWWFALMESVE